MTVFQLILLAASAFFAFKVFEHIQTLQNPQDKNNEPRRADAFSIFSPEALTQRADEAFENGDSQKALALLIEADAKESNNSEVIFKIGYILQQQGDDIQALDYYKKAIEIDKDNEFIHNSMASIYRKNREYISAKLHLNASINIDKENPITYYNYGNLLVDMKKNDEAIEMYEKALQINPDFVEAKQELDRLKQV